ncbi:hypothetical protein [Breoghania sp.]|uniref:hypothetical protein n=1 Tax=Breoghania sp. TaxID=2065378 RepID=UPI002618CB14|nr:hypothetical protein [Breoghania sp.]MDJ0929838.1 hypothetical protein [Breoghania sp.]
MTGLAGLGSGVVPWLLSGGTLHLHHPEDMSGIARHAHAVEADMMVMPGQLAVRTAAAIKKPTTLVVIWQSGAERAEEPIPDHTVVDVTLIQEFAAIAQRREGETYS